MAEEHGKNEGPEMELDSLEIEIDREIDNLFVPVAKKAVPAQALDAGEPESVKTLETGGAGPPEEKPQAGFDIESLALEIDSEIDNLFVPAAKKEEGEEIGPRLTETGDMSASAPRTAMDGPKTPADAPETAAAAPETESPFSPAAEQFPKEASTGFKSIYPPRDELPRLIEEFNAAYLSLDWEFSADNIHRLESALYDLETFAYTAQGSASIFRILKALLARLGAKPEAANNWIVELVRDSHSLLTHLLLTEGPLGPNEKERINALISRFRQMRERAISARRTRTVETSAAEARAIEAVETTNLEPPVPVSAQEEAAGPAPDFEPPSGPSCEVAPPGLSVSAKMPDRWSLLELKGWLESSRVLLTEIAEGTEYELYRIQQIESAMSKTEGLLPVVARLSDIRGSLGRHLNSIREQDDEWSSRIAWVENLERISATHARSAVEPVPEPSGPSEPDEPPGPVADAAPSPAPEEAAPVRREDVIVFHYSDRLYALPESHVAKIREISAKRAKEILKRGYGRLADVKQLFRGIDKGVSGMLAGMSGKDLKSIRFNLIGPDVLQAVQAPLSGPLLAIFASDRNYHGLVLSDSERIDFQAEAEFTPGPCSCPAASGTVLMDSGISVEIIDLGRLAPRDEGDKS